jgi:arsenate reductase
MAEGLLRHFGGQGWEVHSAGTKPGSVNPVAIEAMREIGIDISSQRSKSVTEFENEQFATVVTVCDSAAEHCPIFPGAPRRIHWSLPDPAASDGTYEEKLEVFRRVRNELEARIRTFLAPDE